MPHDSHLHQMNYKHTGPWVSLPVRHLGGLGFWFFPYTCVQNGAGFRTENMSYEKQGIWEFAAGGVAGYHNVYIVTVYHNVYIVAVSPK